MYFDLAFINYDIDTVWSSYLELCLHKKSCILLSFIPFLLGREKLAFSFNFIFHYKDNVFSLNVFLEAILDVSVSLALK